MDWHTLITVEVGSFEDYQHNESNPLAGPGGIRPYYSSGRLLCAPEGLERIRTIAAESARIATVAEEVIDRAAWREAPIGTPAADFTVNVQRSMWTHAPTEISTLEMLRRLAALYHDTAFSAVVLRPADPAREWYLDFQVVIVRPESGTYDRTEWTVKRGMNGGAVYRVGADGAPHGWTLHS